LVMSIQHAHLLKGGGDTQKDLTNTQKDCISNAIVDRDANGK